MGREDDREQRREVRDHGRSIVAQGASTARSGGAGQLQRDPVAFGPAVRELEASGGESLRDLGLAVVEDARREERAAGAGPPATSGSARVTSRLAIRFASTRSKGPSPLGTLPSRPRSPVRGGSAARSRGWRRPRSGPRRQPAPRAPPAARRRSPGSRSREPHVERAAVDAAADQHAALRERLERREAEPRRRVEAGPEGHARVEGEDDVVGLAPMPSPRRPDDDPLSVKCSVTRTWLKGFLSHQGEFNPKSGASCQSRSPGLRFATVLNMQTSADSQAIKHTGPQIAIAIE